jgi:hypothetical protein
MMRDTAPTANNSNNNTNNTTANNNNNKLVTPNSIINRYIQYKYNVKFTDSVSVPRLYSVEL